MAYLYRNAIGQDSHRFALEGGKPLLLAGVLIPTDLKFSANSDGDVLFHAVTNAISGLTGVNVLGKRADEMCAAGVTDSLAYLEDALSHLGKIELVHLSVSVEALKPRLEKHIPEIRRALANALHLPLTSIGLTATTGEGLSGMGRGEGLQVFCILTARERAEEPST